MVDRACFLVIVPAQAIVGQHLASLAQFPPRQRALAIERPNAATSAVTIYLDAANVALGLPGFWYRNCQHAILERSRCFVLIDVLQRNTPLEPAVIPLTKAALLVLRLRFLFAGD